MKIIKNGREYPKQVTCELCNSIIEYEEEDERPFQDQLSGFMEVLFRGAASNLKCITCPVCGAPITLDVKNNLL